MNGGGAVKGSGGGRRGGGEGGDWNDQPPCAVTFTKTELAHSPWRSAKRALCLDFCHGGLPL